MFKANITRLNRIVRYIVGFFLLAWAVAGGSLWGYFGIILLATGAWGFCPVQAMIKRREYRLYEDI